MKVGRELKRLRIANNLTQDELATRADLTKGFISLLERDLTSISMEALIQILTVLGVKMSDFFAQLEAGEVRTVFRASDRVVLEGDDKEETIELLIPGAQQHLMDPVLVTIDPGSASEDQGHEGEEFGMVLKGTAVLELEGQEPQKIRAGECFYFSADRPHRLVNMGKREAQVLWVVSPPVFH